MKKDLFNLRDTFTLISSIALLSVIILAFYSLINQNVLSNYKINSFKYYFYALFFSILSLLSSFGIMIIYAYHLDKILWGTNKNAKKSK